MEKIKPNPSSWKRLLQEMIDDKDFEFAYEFLTDVLNYIEANGRITDKQTAAVLKIRRSVQ
jgi:hypothetical protein